MKRLVSLAIAAAFVAPATASTEPWRFPDGRPLAWDSLGLYPLDAERPLTPGEKQAIAYVKSMELGRAEARAWFQLGKQSDSFVSAWVLTQCARIRGPLQFKAKLDQGRHPAVSKPILAYLRFQALRLERERALAKGVSRMEFEDMATRLRSLARDCAQSAQTNLGVCIGISQGLTDVLERRKVVEAYRAKHPKGPDVRALLCRVYSTGAYTGSAVNELTTNGRAKLEGRHADEPRPDKLLALSEDMLRDDPKDPVAHFYRGRAYFLMWEDEKARRSFQRVADDRSAPAPYRSVALKYLALKKPRESVFNVRFID